MDPRDGRCQRCGTTCRAIGQQVGPRQVPVFTPDIAQKTARWCPRCQKVFCGRCCGISELTLGYVNVVCPECGGKVEFARTDHWLGGLRRPAAPLTPKASKSAPPPAKQAASPAAPPPAPAKQAERPQAPPAPPAKQADGPQASPPPPIRPEKLAPEIVRGETKQCPTCEQAIEAAASTCDRCGARFALVFKGYCSTEHNIVQADEKGLCQTCGKPVLDKCVESTLVEGGRRPPAAEETRPVEPRAEALAAEAAATNKKCPRCGREIKLEARLCRFCKTRVEVAQMGHCIRCDSLVEADANGACAACHGELTELRVVSTLVEDQGAPVSEEASGRAASKPTAEVQQSAPPARLTESDVFALFESGDGAGIVQALQSEDAKVRDAAQFCLADKPDGTMLYAALSTGDKRVRDLVVEALGVCGTPEGQEILAALRSDEKEAIRKLGSGELGTAKATAAKAGPQPTPAPETPRAAARPTPARGREYLLVLYSQTAPSAAQMQELARSVSSQDGLPVEALGAIPTLGPMPSTADSFVIATALLACKERYIAFDAKRDDISFRPAVSAITGTKLGLVTIAIRP
jgi:hypothetical protein